MFLLTFILISRIFFSFFIYEFGYSMPYKFTCGPIEASDQPGQSDQSAGCSVGGKVTVFLPSDSKD